MASISRVIGMFVFCIVSSACSPLQQAPLVYSSKISVGVDVAATATEQPGLSASIGVKTVDAAYVPVAVAKPCDASKMKSTGGKAGGTSGYEKSENLKDCTNPIYKLEHIKGSNEVGSAPSNNKKVEEARQVILNFQKLSSEKEVAEKEYRDAKERLEELQNTMKKDTLSPEEVVSFDRIKAINENNRSDADKIAIADFLKRTVPLNAAVELFNSKKLKKEEVDLSLKEINYKEILDAYELVGMGNEKADSYSVFGSFDSNTKVGGENKKESQKVQAELSLGKVFSTGVASQNLTEGMHKYYENSGIALVERAKAKADCMVVGSKYIESYKATLDASSDDKKRLSKMYEDIISSCNR